MVTLEQAKQHLRMEADDDDPMIEIYLQAAQSWVVQYLNRAIYTDATELAESMSSATVTLQNFSNRLEADLEVAYTIEDANLRAEKIELANRMFRNSVSGYRESVYGMVSNAATDAAILLIMADLYENREASITGISYEANPSVLRLLAPFRVDMGV